jgi:hypothetical protein
MSAPIGQVTSLFDPSVNARVLYGPDGNLVDISASTTKGLQEGLNLAISQGWAFKALPHEPINCTTGLVIPPCGNADIDLGATDIHIAAGCVSPAIFMNSFNGGRFSHKGRLLHFGTPNVVLYIAPTINDPMHGQKIIQNADIQFGDIRACAPVQKLVQLDLGQGEIINNQHLDFLKLDGWNGVLNCAQWGILVTNPGEGIGFNENHIRVGQLNGFYDTGIMVGLGAWNQVYLSDNHWDVNINCLTAVTSGFTTFGGFDYIEMCVTGYGSGTFQYPLIYRPGSQHNKHLIRQSTAMYPVSDSGIGNGAI